jgi:S1-C subfamily serine protease
MIRRSPRVGVTSGPVAATVLLVAAMAPIPVSLAAAPDEAEPRRRSHVVEMVEKVAPAVVNIATDQRVENPFGSSGFGSLLREFFDLPEGGPRERFVPNSLGSGVIIGPEGYVATNEHVILGASRIRVTLQDGRTFLAEVVGTDPDSDLAVLKVGGEGPFPAVRMGRSDDLLIGETVIAIGNPYGFSSSVTTGVVSATGRSIESGDLIFNDYIQTDALINPGNSGGPLLNIKGELIGVNNAVYAPAQGIGFAIPVNRVRRVVEDLIDYGQVRHPWFGFLVEEYALEPSPGQIEAAAGLRVRMVFIDSPADRAGLRPGDRITRVDGRTIAGRVDYDTVLSQLELDENVEMETARDGRPRTLSLRGGEFPADKAGEYFSDLTGMVLEDIPADLRQRYRLLPDEGLMIAEVRRGSRADRMGLQRGDVVIRLDRERLTGEEDLSHLVPDILGRGSFFMVVVRGRVAYNLTFRLP